MPRFVVAQCFFFPTHFQSIRLIQRMVSFYFLDWMGPKIKEKKNSGLQGKGLPNGDRKAVVRLMIGSNLLSVGVKCYLLLRMA